MGSQRRLIEGIQELLKCSDEKALRIALIVEPLQGGFGDDLSDVIYGWLQKEFGERQVIDNLLAVRNNINAAIEALDVQLNI